MLKTFFFKWEILDEPVMTSKPAVEEVDHLNNWQKITSIGEPGSGDEQLNGPSSIALDYPYIWIADYNNSRILKWELQGGTYINKIESVRSNMLIVNEKYLYVMDITNDVIKKYDKHTLEHKLDSDAFTTLIGMTWWRDKLYAVDATTGYLYRINPNTLKQDASWDMSATIGALNTLSDVCANGNYLFILASDGIVYRISENMTADGNSIDLSAYAASGWDYLSAQEDYIFVSGSSEDNFVVIDMSCQFIEDVEYDTDDWSIMRHSVRLNKHTFIAADFTGDLLVIMYGFDRSSGQEAGDTITINDNGDWDFGDDIIIGGTEANLSVINFKRTEQAEPSSRNSWKKGD